MSGPDMDALSTSIPNAVIDWFVEQTGADWKPHGMAHSTGIVLVCRDAWSPSAEVPISLPWRNWYMPPRLAIGMGRIQHVVGDLGQFLLVTDDVSMQFRLRGDAMWSEVDYARIAYEKRLRDARHRMVKGAIEAYMAPEHQRYLSEPWWQDVRDMLAGGHKLDAVKKIKSETGLGLKESKEMFEEYEAAVKAAYGGTARNPAYTPEQAAMLSMVRTEMHKYYDMDEWHEIEECLWPQPGAQKAKLLAVKLLKGYANLTLREAKEVVDEYDEAYTAYARVNHGTIPNRSNLQMP